MLSITDGIENNSSRKARYRGSTQRTLRWTSG